MMLTYRNGNRLSVKINPTILEMMEIEQAEFNTSWYHAQELIWEKQYIEDCAKGVLLGTPTILSKGFMRDTWKLAGNHEKFIPGSLVEVGKQPTKWFIPAYRKEHNID